MASISRILGTLVSPWHLGAATLPYCRLETSSGFKCCHWSAPCFESAVSAESVCSGGILASPHLKSMVFRNWLSRRFFACRDSKALLSYLEFSKATLRTVVSSFPPGIICTSHELYQTPARLARPFCSFRSKATKVCRSGEAYQDCAICPTASSTEGCERLENRLGLCCTPLRQLPWAGLRCSDYPRIWHSLLM